MDRGSLIVDRKNMITQKIIEPALLEQEMQDPTCGAVVTFVGKVRNHHQGKEVISLTYEAYVPMVKKVFGEIIQEAKEKFHLPNIRIVHRVGNLTIGDVAVWIGAQSAHRREAFRACEYTINELKSRAPIWKKEHYQEGEAQWVSCCHSEVP